LDISNEFDAIKHDILLIKLLIYGIRGTAHTLFNGYQSDRQQYCEVNNIQSNNYGLLIFVT
ncbi:hypothetical protein CAPTEDRAFT_143676, partial [Capitella teleta]